MEFPFNINNLLGNTITKLDKTVDPYRRNADGHSYIYLRSQLFQVIDEMGAASAKAQGLRSIITTGRKLELSDHVLYIMKDAEANNGKGAVIGLLKIGHKKLFVYDSLGGNHELTPVCVLDFYVHESRQRMGCGKQLFECMLKNQNIQPSHLAIDKPSFKFSKFLAKHYGLKDEIPQVNNFVVFDGFFQGHKSHDIGNQRRLINRPPSHPNRRNLNDDLYIRHGQASAPVHYGRQINSRPSSGNSRPPSGRLSNRQRNEGVEVKQLHVPVRPPSDQRLELYNMDIGGQIDSRIISHASPRAYGAGANQYSRHTPQGRPGSGNYDRGRNVNQNAESNPPVRRRDGPSDDYKDLFNLHQDFQGRGGHLKVVHDRNNSLPSINNVNGNTVLTNTSPIKNVIYTDQKPTYQPFVQKRNPYSLFDPPPDHRSIAARQYTHTRIW